MNGIINKEIFNDGDIVIDEGSKSNYAYIVLSGEVKITKKADDNKKVIVGNLKKGAVFGEMGLITQSTRTATVAAIGSVEVGMMSKEDFATVLNGIPEDFRSVILALVGRLKMTTDKLATIGLQLENAKRAINSLSIHLKE